MSAGTSPRRMFRCADCGRYTRRSRCPQCRVKRNQQKVDDRGGRWTAKAKRRERAS